MRFAAAAAWQKHTGRRKTVRVLTSLTTGSLRAYELYVARGCEAGQDLDDWLSAERELNHAPAVAAQTANDRDRDER